MQVETSAVYIGTNEGSFTSKDGQEIHFRKAKFSVRDSADTFVLSVAQECDMASLVPYNDSRLVIDFRYNEKSGIWNARLVECGDAASNGFPY